MRSSVAGPAPRVCLCVHQGVLPVCVVLVKGGAAHRTVCAATRVTLYRMSSASAFQAASSTAEAAGRVSQTSSESRRQTGNHRATAPPRRATMRTSKSPPTDGAFRSRPAPMLGVAMYSFAASTIRNDEARLPRDANRSPLAVSASERVATPHFAGLIPSRLQAPSAIFSPWPDTADIVSKVVCESRLTVFEPIPGKSRRYECCFLFVISLTARAARVWPETFTARAAQSSSPDLIIFSPFGAATHGRHMLRQREAGNHNIEKDDA